MASRKRPAVTKAQHADEREPSPPPNPLAEWVAKAGLDDDVRTAVVTWLAKQIVSDQFAKLEQGGHQEGGIPLRKVFVDLPVTEQPSHGTQESSPRVLFLRSLFKRKAASLCGPIEPIGIDLEDDARGLPSGGGPRRRAPRGFLLIGGPGQGKSTLGQLACQVYRALLLAPFADELPTVQRDVVRTFIDPAAQKDIGWPAAPLFPVRVVLPDAAAWLAKKASASAEPAPSLLEMLADQAEARGARIPIDALRALLAHAPVLLILDGLDEVGATEDRTRLVNAVRDLLASLGEAGARGVVVATTRPQGYSGELDRIGIPLATLYLAPLRREEALAYGAKLAQAKLQPDDQARVIAGLQAAAEEQATQRLLTTPLQVTILVALVQRTGQPPSERWALFERYFETIYDREVERRTYAASLLRQQRAHIRLIHARVGLLLQVESEQAGGTQARMPRERLADVADAVLREDDVDDETRADLVHRIVRAAEERLVFLVEPEPGKFGFEIRSLQEFMAAWALATDGDEAVEKRLLQVAKAPMFRAVTLFLTSKLFTEASHLRALAGRVCEALDGDAGDPVAREVRAGATLALEILEEGSVLNQPKHAKVLMARACGLLDLPPFEGQARLARLRGAAADVLRSNLQAKLQEPGVDSALGAWVALVEAASSGEAWAEDLGKAAWERLEDASPVLRACANARATPSEWLAEQIRVSPEKVSPDAVRSLWGRPMNGRAPSLGRGWLSGFVKLARAWRFTTSYRVADRTAFLSEIGSGLAADWGALATLDPDPASWRPWVLGAQFARAPSAATLATTLRRLAESSQREEREALAFVVPWPLAACLRSADTREDLIGYAAMAEAGDLGDPESWRVAERRWRQGFGQHEFFAFGTKALPWTEETLAHVPPLGAIAVSLFAEDEHPTQGWLAHAREVEKQSSEALRRHFAPLFMTLTGTSPADEIADLRWEEVERWAERAGWIDPVVLLRGFRDDAREEWADGLDALGRRRRVPALAALGPYAESMAGIFSEHPERHGLLFWIRSELGVRHAFQRAVGADTRDALQRTLAENPPSDPGLQADALLIQVWLGAITSDQVPATLDRIGQQAASESGLWPELARLAGDGFLPAATREALLLGLLRRPDLPKDAIDAALNALRTSLQSRRTGLADPATWARLALPSPLPLLQPSAQPTFTIPEAPIVLSHIEVHHVRALTDLSLDLGVPAEPDRGQWTVILGPNGAGKTTILRAVALALRNLADPKIWPKGTFATPWRASGLSNGPASIAVQQAGGRTYRITIQKNGSEVFSREPQGAPTPFPVFGYGCRRGSALGGVQRQVDMGEDDGPEVATLFQEGAPLIHAETWLKEWDGAAAKDPPKNGPVYQAVREALKRLLGVDEIEVTSDMEVLVSGASVGKRVPFAAMSDGYLTTAGWFLDLVARWIELSRKHTGSVGPGILDRMTGLVLLDEIDLHLHPRWQVDVIPRVKELLPRMSFVVTTHNPLTLVGARPEEIWILSTDGGEVRAEQGVEAPMLLTGGQIYSRYFGIRDIYPSELGEALRRYGFLSGDPLRTDEEQVEMEGLRARLKQHGIEPGWEEAPRESPRPAPVPSRKRAKRKAETK